MPSYCLFVPVPGETAEEPRTSCQAAAHVHGDGPSERGLHTRRGGREQRRLPGQPALVQCTTRGA